MLVCFLLHCKTNHDTINRLDPKSTTSAMLPAEFYLGHEADTYVFHHLPIHSGRTRTAKLSATKSYNGPPLRTVEGLVMGTSVKRGLERGRKLAFVTWNTFVQMGHLAPGQIRPRSRAALHGQCVPAGGSPKSCCLQNPASADAPARTSRPKVGQVKTLGKTRASALCVMLRRGCKGAQEKRVCCSAKASVVVPWSHSMDRPGITAACLAFQSHPIAQ